MVETAKRTTRRSPTSLRGAGVAAPAPAPQRPLSAPRALPSPAPWARRRRARSRCPSPGGCPRPGPAAEGKDGQRRGGGKPSLGSGPEEGVPPPPLRGQKFSLVSISPLRAQWQSGGGGQDRGPGLTPCRPALRRQEKSPKTREQGESRASRPRRIAARRGLKGSEPALVRLTAKRKG